MSRIISVAILVMLFGSGCDILKDIITGSDEENCPEAGMEYWMVSIRTDDTTRFTGSGRVVSRFEDCPKYNLQESTWERSQYADLRAFPSRFSRTVSLELTRVQGNGPVIIMLFELSRTDTLRPGVTTYSISYRAPS